MSGLLTFIRNFSVSAHPPVTTSQKFWEDCGVKWMSKDFKTQFVGLVVEAVDAGVLSISKLEKNSLDTPILSEFGVNAETTVLNFAELLNQNRGSDEFFIGYLRGHDGNPWAVSASWYTGDDVWYAHAFSVTHPIEWSAGGQVVSLLPAGKAGE